MWVIPIGTSLAFKKKNQAKSPSICSHTLKPVRIRQSGRTENRGVTTYAYNRLIFIRVSRRSYRAYSYSEIPESITYHNDTHLFPLIHYPGYYHITMGIPRPVLIKV